MSPQGPFHIPTVMDTSLCLGTLGPKYRIALLRFEEINLKHKCDASSLVNSSHCQGTREPGTP